MQSAYIGSMCQKSKQHPQTLLICIVTINKWEETINKYKFSLEPASSIFGDESTI